VSNPAIRGVGPLFFGSGHRRVAHGDGPEYHSCAMFIVKWNGPAPDDKREWIDVLRDTLAAELGSYRVVFQQGQDGWRFTLEWRPDDQLNEDGLIANSPDSVAFNIYQSLLDAGKPLEPGWTP
jgi:hypothetical protein